MKSSQKLVLAALSCCSVFPAHSLLAAPATLTLYPSTDIYDRGRFHLDSDLVSRNARQTTFASAGLNYGLGSGRDGLFGRTDVGIEYLPAPLNGVSAGRRVIFNAKTQLYNHTRGAMTMRLVMGVRGLGRRGGIASGNTVGPKNVAYLVGSRTFGFGRLHLGVAHSFADRAFLLTPAGNADRTYLQLGYDRALGSKFRFSADYYTGKSSISALAPGITYYVDDKANFQVGLIRYNDSSIAPRTQVIGSFNYDFGGEPPYRIEEGESEASTVPTSSRAAEMYQQSVTTLSPAEQRELANRILEGLPTAP